MTSTGWRRAGPAGVAAELLRHAAGEFAGSNYVRRHEAQASAAGGAGISG